MRNTVRQETTLYDWSLFKKTYCDWLNLNTCHRSTNQARGGLRSVMRNLIRIVYTKIGFISSISNFSNEKKKSCSSMNDELKVSYIFI